MARAADLLTLSRFALSLALAIALGAQQLSTASVLLAIAWATDVVDGRLARRADDQTRLGTYDPIADASLGVAILIGLGVSGSVPLLISLAVVIGVGAWFAVSRVLSLLMTLQALAYATLFWQFFVERTPLWWVSVSAGALIAVVDAPRLFQSILPVFFGGFRSLAGGENKHADEPDPLQGR